MDTYFIIIPTCIFVKGAFQSAIYDPQRENIDYIPNDMYDFCFKFNKKKISDILYSFTGEEKEIVSEYLDFLFKHEYAISGTSKDAKSVMAMPLAWNYIGSITNCICEYSQLTYDKINTLLEIIDNELKCQAFQLLSFDDTIPIEILENILKHFGECTHIHHIEIIMPYDEEHDIKKIQKLLRKYLLINRIIIYSSPFKHIEQSDHTILSYIQQSVNRSDSCGFINTSYFALNLLHITESMKYNSCLNRKMFIDKFWDIKNCPFQEKIFGNIFSNNVHHIIAKKEFQFFWNITKNKIETCKDCEHRYVCSDCRIFIKNKDNSYSQPAKCNYNPYIGKWLGEEGYITVEDFKKNNK